MESSFKCNLASDKTLNSVEMFIPKFVDSFLQIGDSTEELFFLFPVNEDKTETQFFEVLLKHEEATSLDRLNSTLTALSFDEVATCNSSTILNSSLRLTKQIIIDSPVIAEKLDCEYINGFNYATMKLVLEQFIDALLKNNSPVDLIYSEKEDSNHSFQWTNIFLSIESRQEFVESWQALEISKEIQALLLEQSICQSSELYRRYKVL